MPAAVIRLAGHCDNQCLFCAQRSLPFTEAGSPGTLLSAARATSDALLLTGGEPALVDDDTLVALLTEARALGFRTVGLQTNGRALAVSGRLSRLSKAGLTDLHLSLHGAEASVHDYHAGTAGAFVQVLSTLGAARATGLRVVVTTVLTRSNYRVLDALPRLLRNSGVQAWNVLVPRAAGGMGDAFDRLMPRLAMALPFALHAVDAAVKQGLPAFIEGAPACLLGPMAGRALESDARAHAPVCHGCPSRGHCPGVDATYLERFHGDELVARATQPPMGDHPELRRLFVGVGPLAPLHRPQPARQQQGPLVKLGRERKA